MHRNIAKMFFAVVLGIIFMPFLGRAAADSAKITNKTNQPTSNTMLCRTPALSSGRTCSYRINILLISSERMFPITAAEHAPVSAIKQT